ncbi:helix-turn-helix transcriptional regulator [Salinibaculum rarum]|uniref:helix-turn-helix transcriptional regulator n=1 Tax=Salinibaculum rarum TaxID=3058903 RepID=UPI00265E20DD|nr:MarR family transcriptional regulator [Salinibaculum sp. KK48]
MEERDAVLEFLTRSETRRVVLGRLAAEGPCRQSTLADVLGVSARTVKRTLDDLGDREWVTQTESGYALTALGEQVMRTYETAVTSLDAAATLEPLLTHLRGDFCDIPVDAFADAEVVEATKSSPNAPIERALALRASADRLRELSSIVAKESANQLHRRIRNGELSEAELVLERDVLETIDETPAYRESFDEIVANPNVTSYVHDGPFPCLLILSEEHVAVGATNDDGFPAAIAVASSSDARSWAESVYERFRIEATRLPE